MAVFGTEKGKVVLMVAAACAAVGDVGFFFLSINLICELVENFIRSTSFKYVSFW